MSYHTVYPRWDCPAGVCHLFLYIIPSSVHQQLNYLDCQNCVHYTQLSGIFYLSLDLSQYRVSFFKGTHTFQNCLRGQHVKVCAHLSVLEKVFFKIKNSICMISSLLPPPFPPIMLSPIQNLKESLNMPRRMYYPSLITPFPSILTPPGAYISNFQSAKKNATREPRVPVSKASSLAEFPQDNK